MKLPATCKFDVLRPRSGQWLTKDPTEEGDEGSAPRPPVEITSGWDASGIQGCLYFRWRSRPSCVAAWFYES